MVEEVTTQAVVIGAGWSGIYALKYLVSEGVTDIIAVDKRDVVGGLWAISDDKSITTVADCTYTSSPKLFTEASDFPWPEHYGLYARYDQIHEYLQSYVKHFDLMKYIWLKTTVECIQKKDGLWCTKVFRDGKEMVLKSTYLVVCTGVNMKVNKAYQSKFDGYTGEVVHANDIRYVKQFEDLVRDKNVVAIGGGEGSSDLSYFGSKVSKSYTLCIPHGQWMQVRNYLTRLVPIHKIHPVTIDKLTPKQVLPWEYQKVVFRSFIRPMWGSNGWDRYAVRAVNGKYGHGCEAWRPIGPIYGNFGNKADLIQHALKSGRLTPKRNVVRCEGRTVYFCDGSCQEDVDLMLLCTGYCIGFPFLPEEFQPCSIRELYKNIFHVNDPTLAFVGFSRPTQGSIPQLAELASLLVAKTFSGKHSLPPKEIMVETAKQDKQEWDIFFRYASGRVTGLVDGIIYSRSICKELGIDFKPFEVLRMFGFRDWIRYLNSPNSVHSFLGKLPERREQFLQFIRSNTLFVLSPPQARNGILLGIYDLLYYQVGRFEGFYRELFEPETRAKVGKYLLKESSLEKWWLTTIWDLITVGLLAMLFAGYYRLLLAVVAGFAFLMVMIYVVVTRMLLHAGKLWTNRYGEKYPTLVENPILLDHNYCVNTDFSILKDKAAKMSSETDKKKN